ncbi:MAG TPA: restriction endonuclease subunit S [Spirochaetota bacterium]|nr:restriction endonuclease subunit S [Spirochaetota bacterium]HNT13126.1 restriction endonuclease subunit S [Spirochaetota bacterium]
MTVDIEFNTSLESLPFPPGWRLVKLGDVCEFNPRRPQLNRNDELLTSFVPMTAIDGKEGIITNLEKRPYKDVKKGYTYFDENDVLFAKITPCMQNGKHAIARFLIDGFGFGSTEFHVIRPLNGISPEWIHFFIRQPHILKNATAYFTGAVGQQRVPEDYLITLQIPLPPLPEQKRIAAVLHEKMATVEKARAAVGAQLEAVMALPVVFLKGVFPQLGDVLPAGWSWVKLGDVCDRIDYGYTASADFSIEEPKFLRITDIQNGHVNWESVPGCRINSDEEIANQIMDGDIVFARTGGTTGKSYLIQQPPRSVFASYLIRLSPSNQTISKYLYLFFQSDLYWTQIRKAARGGAQPNVNASLLSQLNLPLPSLAEQKRIAAVLSDKLSQLEKIRVTIEEQLKEINALPSTILRKAFSGGF